MLCGFTIEGGDANAASELAQEAEAAGWDGVFIADAMDIGMPNSPPFPWFDPWIVLAAMAMRTERIRIGTMITPVPRRRPWKLARETVTLDQLSNGRLIFGAGLGAAEHDGGFYKVGEAMDLKIRAERLDEGLAILAGLWSGKPFSFSGHHYRVQEMTMLPPPVQSPRIPIWVPGVWTKEKSMRRALKMGRDHSSEVQIDGTNGARRGSRTEAIRRQAPLDERSIRHRSRRNNARRQS